VFAGHAAHVKGLFASAAQFDRPREVDANIG
jgi:hypothetical protein